MNDSLLPSAEQLMEYMIRTTYKLHDSKYEVLLEDYLKVRRWKFSYLHDLIFALIRKEQKKIEEVAVGCFKKILTKTLEILNKNNKTYYNVSYQLPKHLCMVLYGKNHD